MRKSKIKAKLQRNEPCLALQLHLTDGASFEMASLLGFDGIWMDLEHHGYSVETATTLMRAARVGTSDIIARPAKGEFMRLGRLLEAGAQAIMYPRCDSPGEAAEIVRWSKFAPLGCRGFDGGNADALYTTAPLRDYIEHANRETVIIVQLEHPEAIEQADAIAAIDGIDVLMFGPADYSVISGIPGEFDHPRIAAAAAKIAAAARKAGKQWARTVRTLEDATVALELGCRLLFHNADIVILKNGLLQMQSQFASLGFSFDSQITAETG